MILPSACGIALEIEPLTLRGLTGSAACSVRNEQQSEPTRTSERNEGRNTERELFFVLHEKANMFSSMFRFFKPGSAIPVFGGTADGRPLGSASQICRDQRSRLQQRASPPQCYSSLSFPFKLGRLVSRSKQSPWLRTCIFTSKIESVSSVLASAIFE